MTNFITPVNSISTINLIDGADKPANDCQLTVADVSKTVGLTDQYDDLLLRLCDTQAHSTSIAAIKDSADSNTRFCHHLRHALQSDTAYLCNRNTLQVVASSSTASAGQQCEDTDSLHHALTTMVSDLHNCNSVVYLANVGVFPESDKYCYIVTPLNAEQLLVVVDAQVPENLLGHYFSEALTGLYLTFQSIQFPNQAECESSVFDFLHTTFKTSSNAVTSLRMKHFNALLRATPVGFDDISPQSGKTHVDHSEEPLCSVLPEQLYKIASLWGDNFKTEIDSYCLTESSYGYKTLCENHELLKFETSRALQIKVHAQSLKDSSYTSTLNELAEKSVIHRSRLLFNLVSDNSKSDLDDQLAQDNVIEQFTRQFQAQSSKAAKAKKTGTIPGTIRGVVNIADEFDLLGTHGVRAANSKAVNQP